MSKSKKNKSVTPVEVVNPIVLSDNTTEVVKEETSLVNLIQSVEAMNYDNEDYNNDDLLSDKEVETVVLSEQNTEETVNDDLSEQVTDNAEINVPSIVEFTEEQTLKSMNQDVLTSTAVKLTPVSFRERIFNALRNKFKF